MGDWFSGGKPNKEDYATIQPDQDLRQRYLAIIDKYLVDKGIVDYMPRESRPYELRDDRDRGEWRNSTGNQINEQGGFQHPSLNNGVYFNTQQVQNNTPANTMQNTQASQNNPRFKEGSDSQERLVSSQAQAPTTSAPQQNQVPLTTNTAFFQEDQRRKQEEYNKVKDYIYRDSRR